MAWWNIFKKASEIDRLNNELDFSRRQLQFAQGRIDADELKIELLEKSVRSERDKRDKFVYVAMDKLTKNAGTFQKSLLPPEPEKPVQYSPEIEAQIMAAAIENRNADIFNEIEPQPVEYYTDIIRSDPEKYLPH